MRQDSPNARLHNVVLDQRLVTPPFQGAQVGTIVSATTYTCTVIIPAYSETVAFYDVPYKRSAVVPVADDPNTPMIPPPGTQCLVIFTQATDTQASLPWVICFKDWP